MSFIDSIVSAGKSAFDFVTGDTTGGALARSAILGVGLNQFQKHFVNDNEDPKNDNNRRDGGVRERVDPDTQNVIPILYGDAYIQGVVSDARLTNNRFTMWYCITLCEQTGTKLSDGQPSTISFKEVFWNGLRITFQSDGVTVGDVYDEDDVKTDNFSGLVKFYPFSGGSNKPVGFATESNSNGQSAQQLFPEWPNTNEMNDLVFCLVRVDYAANKGVTGLGRLNFRLSNDMKKPGDVLNDYLNNKRYGAGIPPEEIST